MLDEEGRTRLKLKVCLSMWMSALGFLLELKCIFLPVLFYADCLLSCCRWKIRFGGEPKGTRRETKHERATPVLSNGLMEGVCYRQFAHCKQDKVVVVFFFKRTFFSACPSTWGMKCLTFTKHLCRETTTTCSYDRVLVCRDKLSSKPNSHSGNTVKLYLFSNASGCF